MKRLVAHLRVFFDKRSGKAERIEQFIAEHGIENGLQVVARPIGTLARQEPRKISIPQTAFIQRIPANSYKVLALQLVLRRFAESEKTRAEQNKFNVSSTKIIIK